MAQTAVLAGVTECEGLGARAIVCHGAGDRYAKAVVISDCSAEEGDSTYCLQVGEDGGAADAGGIINTDMHIFPPDTPALALASAVPVQAMTDSVETRHCLDVQMGQLARMFAHIAPHRLGRFEVRQPGQGGLAEHHAHAGR